jgi:tetraprenyl-beta-curcumene synthase
MSSPGLALAVANARYWTGVAPLARAPLGRWEERAGTIGDPALRELALAKLRAERFNAEVAATLATLAPRARRARTVEAIVALEVMYDYLDGLTEQPAADPLRSGRALFAAFTDALATAPAGAAAAERSGFARTQKRGVDARGGRDGADAQTSAQTDVASAGTGAQTGDYFRDHHANDGGYLAALSATTSAALAGLPAWSAVADTARRSAARCAEAQVRVHAAPRAGAAQLEEWARTQAAGTVLQWREFMAGAVSSVLSVHALIAAAADARTTDAEAAAIDSAYLSISALSTMLDSAIDYEADSARGEAWYVRHYDSRAALADRVAAVTRDARDQAQTLPHAAHHTMTLVGVVAYYTSAPQARRGIAAALARRAHEQLGPVLVPTLAVMRTWRRAKTLRQGLGGNRRTKPSAGVSVDDEQTTAPNQQLTVTTGST